MFRFDFQASLSRGGGDKLDDDFMTDQRLAAPILGDVTEEPMLDLVPLARRRRKMTDADLQAGFLAQLRQAPLPKMAARAVAAAAVGRDEQTPG